VDFLTKLLNKYSHFSPIITEQEEVSKNKKDFGILLSLSLLEKISDPQHIWCKTCQSEGVEVHYVSKDRAYTLCNQQEDAGRDYFNPSEIKQWQLNALHLLSLFQKALGIQSPKLNENIQGLLWDFGTQKINGASYHLFFCRNINEIEKSKLSIITNLPHSVLFYTGTPQVALPDKVLLVPIIDLIQKISNKGLSLEKEVFEQFFPKNVYATKDGAIELDEKIVLQDNHIMFEPLRGGVFRKQSAKLRPRGTQIIEHLFGIRKNQQNSKTLDELAGAFDSTKVAISNEINRIEKACTDNNLQSILHKYSGDKWGINPHLSSCK
jgi:hypothetical protein